MKKNERVGELVRTDQGGLTTIKLRRPKDKPSQECEAKDVCQFRRKWKAGISAKPD